MTRIRLIMLSLFAIFAMSAVASSSASALEYHWWVAGNPVVGTEKFEFSDIEPVAEGGNRSVIVYHNKEIQIECPEISFVNKLGEETGESNPNPPDTLLSEAFIEGPNGGSIHQVQFSGCVVVKPALPGCALAPTGEDDISTLPVIVTLSKTTGVVTLTPKETNFASFKLNASCGVLAGEYKVKGSTAFTISEPESCKEVHKITFKEEPSKLIIAGLAVEKFEVIRNLEGVESDKCWDAKKS
jgi:hypothetical protein